MDSILLLISVQRNLYRFGGPVFLALGSISCILSFIVFTKKHLRKNPCSIYFAAINISNFIFIYSSLFLATLSYGYDINLYIFNIYLCRFSIYVPIVFESFTSFFLFFASIDRILITSSNALTRQRSTRRLAIICVIGTILFWSLIHIHALILTSIQEFGPSYFVCYFQPGTYLTVVSYYSLVKAFLTPVVMISCGLWAVKNIRSIQRIQVAPTSWASRAIVVVGQHSTSSKDRQLVLMVLIDIAAYIVFGFMLAGVLIQQQITQYQVKDFNQIQLESFLRQVAGFSVTIPFCIGLYTNLLVSKTFRNEVKNVFTGTGAFICRQLHR